MTDLTNDISQIALLVAQMLQSNAQPSTMKADDTPQTEPTSTDQDMNAELHSVGARTPSHMLSEFLSLETDLLRVGSLSDTDRTRIIEYYPPIDNLSYNPPQILPTTTSRMNKAQKREDKLHQQLQYTSSTVFRPLDILSHKITLDSENLIHRGYLYMLRDIRLLLLHNMTLINLARNNHWKINKRFQSVEIYYEFVK